MHIYIHVCGKTKLKLEVRVYYKYYSCLLY